MFGLGATELWVIAIIVLVLFGGSRIPVFARGFGEAIREFKKSIGGEEETKPATASTATGKVEDKA